MRSFPRGVDRFVAAFAVGAALAAGWEARRRQREAAAAAREAHLLQLKLQAGLTALGKATAANERLQGLVAECRQQNRSRTQRQPRQTAGASTERLPFMTMERNGVLQNAEYLYVAARARLLGPFGSN